MFGGSTPQVIVLLLFVDECFPDPGLIDHVLLCQRMFAILDLVPHSNDFVDESCPCRGTVGICITYYEMV